MRGVPSATSAGRMSRSLDRSTQNNPCWRLAILGMPTQPTVDGPSNATRLASHWHLYSSPMLVFCAWCRHEQKVGYLGMREPLENPVGTHGVCREHQQRLLESFPSRSFPGVELLIVVRRNGTTLYESLERA